MGKKIVCTGRGGTGKTTSPVCSSIKKILIKAGYKII